MRGRGRKREEEEQWNSFSLCWAGRKSDSFRLPPKLLGRLEFLWDFGSVSKPTGPLQRGETKGLGWGSKHQPWRGRLSNLFSSSKPHVVAKPLKFTKDHPPWKLYRLIHNLFCGGWGPWNLSVLREGTLPRPPEFFLVWLRGVAVSLQGVCWLQLRTLWGGIHRAVHSLAALREAFAGLPRGTGVRRFVREARDG